MRARFVNLKKNKKHTVPHPRVIFTEQYREKERGRVPKERGRVPIPPFEYKSSGESSYYQVIHSPIAFFFQLDT